MILLEGLLLCGRGRCEEGAHKGSQERLRRSSRQGKDADHVSAGCHVGGSARRGPKPASAGPPTPRARARQLRTSSWVKLAAAGAGAGAGARLRKLVLVVLVLVRLLFADAGAGAGDSADTTHSLI